MEYNLSNIFTYHKPIGNQAERYELIRDEAKDLAKFIMKVCPESPERTKALRYIENCVMWANASIARNEGRDDCVKCD